MEHTHAHNKYADPLVSSKFSVAYTHKAIIGKINATGSSCEQRLFELAPPSLGSVRHTIQTN